MTVFTHVYVKHLHPKPNSVWKIILFEKRDVWQKPHRYQ